jgi:uncharacterized OB-fold protein
MFERTKAPEIAHIPIPIDAWSAPFWEGAARRELLVPRCGACGRHRWPSGPFCPQCQSQDVAWVPAGAGHVYSFTIVPGPASTPGGVRPRIAPALIEFPQAGGVRIMGAIVDSPIEAIAIDHPVNVQWREHGERNIPVFRLS